MRALIVDDNAEFAEMLKLTLGPYMEADYVPNGTEGVKAFCAALKLDQPYGVILLDLQMPMRDGLDTVRYIRSIENRLMISGPLSTKIIVVTGFPEKAMAARAMLAGCEAVVAKSAGPAAILEKLNELGLMEDF